MSGQGGGIALGQLLEASPDMQDFRFSSTRCDAVGAQAISNAVASCTKLIRLDLRLVLNPASQFCSPHISVLPWTLLCSDNMFGPANGAILAASLPALSILTDLNLCDIALADAGVRIFVLPLCHIQLLDQCQSCEGYPSDQGTATRCLSIARGEPNPNVSIIS